MTLSSYPGRAALVVAHPSHELRVHGWLENSRPYVCILTDGRGRSGESRLQNTSDVLARAGATEGAIYGRLSDTEVYAAILNGDSELFALLVEELAQAFVDEQIDYVVGDAAEGYSVTHDICRVMIDAAIELVEAEHGKRIVNVDFLLVGDADHHQENTVTLHLDDVAFARKINAALSYSPKLAQDVETALTGALFQGIRRFSEPQLAGEVDLEMRTSVLQVLESQPQLKAQLTNLVDDVPLDALRIECLRPVGNNHQSEPVFYELYGEKLVAAGRYAKVIRYRQHMLPLAQAIRAKNERKEFCVGYAS